MKKGHDDILFGAMLANLSLRQYAPPRTSNSAKTHSEEEDEEIKNKMGLRGDKIIGEPDRMAKAHIEEIMTKVRNYPGSDYEES